MNVATDARIPWEDPGVRFPVSLGRTWVESMTAPTRFFRSVDTGLPVSRPVLYFLILTVAGSLFATLWGLVGSGPELPQELMDASGLAGGPDVNAKGLLVLGFFLSPFTNLVVLGIAALAVHLCVRLLTDSERKMRDTTRVLCYAASAAVLTIVPWIGDLAAPVATLVLAVIGLREMHATTTGRAIAVVAIPVLASWVLLFLSLMFALAVVGSLGELPLG